MEAVCVSKIDAFFFAKYAHDFVDGASIEAFFT
jgi:hypothetical protein